MMGNAGPRVMPRGTRLPSGNCSDIANGGSISNEEPYGQLHIKCD